MTRRLSLRGAVAIAALALLAGLAAPTLDAAGAGAAGAVGHNPKGRLLGAIPSRPSAAGAPAAVGRAQSASPFVPTPVTYHGGPIQHSSAVYAIFWKPSTYTFPTNYAATIALYLGDIAHDSYTAANPYGSDTQYYDIVATKKRFMSYAVTYKGVISDTHAYPANGCPNYTLDDGTLSKKCITDAQIRSEIQSVITAHALPKGTGIQYFLFTPKGVASCYTANALNTGGCYNPLTHPGYCAYHSFTGSGAQVVVYANMHFAQIAGCSSGQSPEGNAADSVINGISHEHQETFTDPFGTAWYDSHGSEIADKCEFMFGAPLGSTPFGQFNEVINGHDYWLQEIWSNQFMDCVQRNVYPQPTASFTYSPGNPLHGTTVSFHSTSVAGDATALTYRWTFPDGSVSTLKNPTFVFPAAGAKNVQLVVFDVEGDQSRVIRTVTVH